MTTRGSKRAPLYKILGVALALTLGAAACGGDSSSKNATSSSSSSSAAPAACKKVDAPAITIGYSAWPGWFPWKIAEQKCLFADAGLNVNLKFFDNYTDSLTALSAGQLDLNSQTLNDTLSSVAAGSPQTAVIVGDNSAGNDAVIVDQDIKTVADLKGKTVAVEAVVVDNFLLDQGLKANNLTENDVTINNLPTDQAAAAFAAGNANAAAVFAPFIQTALGRAGSHVLFSSKDYPGTIPDFLVAGENMLKNRSADIQKLVSVWYSTLDFMNTHADEAFSIMAAQANQSVADYKAQAGGTRLFAAQEAYASLTGTAATDLPAMTDTVAQFLVDSKLATTKPSAQGVLDPSFTKAYLDANGSTSASSSAPAGSPAS
jgi:NitT/TauT family transport system substrate-binding protein